ncbi:MAG: SMC-Scp complex subunit ScpB [Pseudothermotoga sp.]|nr:SMC-Scp complex subunit ScpB [Pseudothermotoga sp.]
MNLRAAVEAILFASRGTTLKKISNLLKVEEEKLIPIIEEIEKEYLEDRHGVELKKIGDVYRFYTKSDYSQLAMKATNVRAAKLTLSQLEIVAAIALNGPLTVTALNEIRGKESSHLVRALHKMGILTKKRKSGRYVYDLSKSFRETIAIESMLGPQAEHTVKPSS